MPARACVGWKPPARDVSVAGEGAIRGDGVMRIVAAAMATGLVAGLASFVEAQSPSDPPGLTCVTWQNQWRAEGANMTLAQATAFRGRVPAACAGTRAAVQVRIDALTRAADQQPAQQPRPDPCANANAAWAYLSRSSDRAALQAFIADTHDSCAVDAQARARIAELDRAAQAARDQAERQRQAEAERQRQTTTPQQQPAQAAQPFRDCSECPEMVRIPGGTYTQGSPASEGGDSDERPQRSVSVRAFALGRTEVTRGEWAAFVRATNRPDPQVTGATHCTWRSPGFAQDDTHPVVCVNHADALAYVAWLNERTQNRFGFRLPSEAEWEYAARGGDRAGPYWWGSTASHEYANYGADAQGRDRWVNTAPVGQFPANPFGLNDMHGNMWEWVQDCYANPYPASTANGSAYEPSSCSVRVVRGGSWGNDPQDLRSANRNWLTPTYRGSTVGFRVARTLN